MDQEKILALYKEGMGIKSIARKLNTYPNAIKRVLLKMGVYNAPLEDRVTTLSNKGDNQVTGDNQPSKSSDNQAALQQYKKALCKNSDTCSVCNLEPEKLKLLEELYIAGTPSPVLHNYFNVTSKDLGYHAYCLNWHHKRARWEDPRRKKAVKEALENEVWQTIMSSKVDGNAGDRISAMKLAAQMQGIMGDSEGKGQGMSPGVIVNMRFSLNAGESEEQAPSLSHSAGQESGIIVIEGQEEKER